MNNINIEVSLASQTHHVPHIGLPQIEPVTRVSRANKAPTGAMDLDKISARGCLQIMKKIEQTASKRYENRASQALGTWTYIMRTAEPCTMSSGLLKSAKKTPAMKRITRIPISHGIKKLVILMKRDGFAK